MRIALIVAAFLALSGVTAAQAESAMAKKYEAGPAIAGNMGPNMHKPIKKMHKMHKMRNRRKQM